MQINTIKLKILFFIYNYWIMSVKEHYDNHLANFYNWYIGDVETNKNKFKTFCIENNLMPFESAVCIDLGAGNGIQSIALAELGFKVKAIDFNQQLLNELSNNVGNLEVKVYYDDIRLIGRYSDTKPELIVCCGDTLSHLDNLSEIETLMADSCSALVPRGRIVLSFRDYSLELSDTQRFIPVKSDGTRILTCFLEYFADKVRVTDLLHELKDGKWVQKVSSYFKTRITKEWVIEKLQTIGFEIVLNQMEKGMVWVVAKKM
jgi:2-polyprenyl-3-methyl-5-hydroxy-6-metoxy-1,4-benzoquinol methylase